MRFLKDLQRRVSFVLDRSSAHSGHLHSSLDETKKGFNAKVHKKNFISSRVLRALHHFSVCRLIGPLQVNLGVFQTYLRSFKT